MNKIGTNPSWGPCLGCELRAEDRSVLGTILGQLNSLFSLGRQLPLPNTAGDRDTLHPCGELRPQKEDRVTTGTGAIIINTIKIRSFGIPVLRFHKLAHAIW